MKIKTLNLALVASMAWGTAASAQTEIQWWHAFTGRLGDLLDAQVALFNSNQSDYKVVATHKGNYSGTLNAGIAAFRAGEAPPRRSGPKEPREGGKGSGDDGE